VSDPLPAFLENEQAPWLSLNGEWRFSLAGGPTQPVPVPAAWEVYTKDKTIDGPALYRCTFKVPASRVDRGRLILEFGAASYWALVRVNSVQVTVHQGLWSPFQVDIGRWAHAGENSLEVEMWKPGRRFPPRETLAGFLPDVASAFGGLWQGVRLLALDAAIADLKVLAKPNSLVVVSGSVVGLDTARAIEIVVEVNPGQAAVEPIRIQAEIGTGRFSVELNLTGSSRWQPGSPALHNLVVSAWQNGQSQARATRRIGLRDIVALETGLWHDDRPLHLRGVLDWGWNPDQIRPAASREAVVQQIEQSRALGFNLIKLCLFVPDEVAFQVADEVGQYLWLEMPLWLPRLTPEARDLARREFEAIFRRLHHHASIAVVSLGCELNAEADAAFLAELHGLARAWFPNALICDNSGSAEAYGGVATTLQDFYDYHFYADPHFFQPLVEHFERGYRARKPWLFGEFCDADTGRNFNALQPDAWWLNDPLTLDRDDFRYTRDYQARLASAGIADGGAALTASGRRQATAVRKFILEQTRTNASTGGYVISGWKDTPITTSGIVDDQGELKFSAEDWLRFNADAVLVLDRARHRRWVAGGDRPAYHDPFSWWAGEEAEVHLLLSHALGDIASGQLFWRAVDAGEKDLGSGIKTVGALPGGQVTEIAALRWRMPDPGVGPMELSLQAGLSLNLAGGQRQSIQNRWPLWVVPRPSLGQSVAVIGLDALLERYDMARLSPESQLAEPKLAPLTAPLLGCEMGAILLNSVQAGRNAVLWQTLPDRRYTRQLPFWREAIHVFNPHALWMLVPQPGYADMRFFSVATDMAIDLAGLQALLGPTVQCRPVWRRFDARSLTWADYVVEVQYGSGRLFVSTLRFSGGLGRQPEGFEANPWGAWMLASLLRAPR
jgi:hypothetical protein